MNGRNIFQLEKVSVNNSTIFYTYNIEGEWSKYFWETKHSKIEYSIDISGVPESILAIPLICNILPVAWICDATIYLDSLDKDFYDNIEKIKSGYKNMFPMFEFKGAIKTKVIMNKPDRHIYNAACFFSGGVDAYTTLFRHLGEMPCLVTIWGADVALSDTLGWGKVKSHCEQVAEEFNLYSVFIKSDFRQILDEGALSQFVQRSGDGWWHGFQHGIAIISHAAPIAYVYGLLNVYIASSYPENMRGKYVCASDPSIDEHVHYCQCNTIHDGYEMSRQEKVRYLVNQRMQTGKKMQLRVCWESKGGDNCCHCEKCYRTVLEIVSEGGNPNEYGFSWNDERIKTCKRDMLTRTILLQSLVNQYYPPIVQALKEHKNDIPDFEKYKWLFKLDFIHFNDYPLKKLYYSYACRIARRIYQKCLEGVIRNAKKVSNMWKY